MARGQVMKHKWDANGKIVGRANVKPILNTREYSSGKVMEVMENMIAEPLSAQCC